MALLPNVARCVLPLVMLVSACAGPRVLVEKRDDGIYHLTCKAPLSACIDGAAKLCEGSKFVVLRGVDDREFRGLPSDTAEQFMSSEAFVRCGSPHVLGLENGKLLEQPICAAPTAAPAPPPAPARACTPGSSQACVGPGGCHGGQACEPDGMRFGACDCAPAASAAPAAP